MFRILKKPNVFDIHQSPIAYHQYSEMSQMITFTQDISIIDPNQRTTIRRPLCCLILVDMPIGTGDIRMITMQIFVQIEIDLNKCTEIFG